MRSRGLVLTQALRVEPRRRVLLAMSRFGPGVERVTVRLNESENLRGGVDRRCRVRAYLPFEVVLQAEAINGALEEAVGRSASRLARRVASALGGGVQRRPGAGPRSIGEKR